MKRRRLLSTVRALVLCIAALAPTALIVPPAGAACPAPDPDELSITEMIAQGTTGDARYEVLFLGRVIGLRDLRGDRGGYTLARFDVREHPVGWAPDRSQVRFWKEPLPVPHFNFYRAHHYAVVAHRRDNGVFRFEEICGQTAEISRDDMWQLIHLFRHG